MRALMQYAMICACLASCSSGRAEDLDVTAKLQMSREARVPNSAGIDSPQVVAWLTPLSPDGHAIAPGQFRIAQKDKMFRPHLLVVPVGSEVSFPNLDPFFHNVFSLFNGKRFDLGLYQAGSSKGVHFNHEGVSFIFCNIHPEMSAVIVALATPYYAVAVADGRLLLHDIPAGSYKLSLWSEGIDSQQLAALDRIVTVSAGHTDLGSIQLLNDVNPAPHKNKFGQDYSPDSVIY